MKSTTTLEDKSINTFEELMALVEPFRKDGKWIFRGVRQSDYELMPKIGRLGSRKEISSSNNLPYDRKSEKTMIKHFIRAAGPYVAHLPENELEWLALAQHHGMFTRLLDWSESLLVAAYFAVEDARQRKLPPMIYCARDIPLAPSDSNYQSKNIADVALYYPPHISTRIPAQSSVFTVHRKPDQPFNPPKLIRLTLPKYPFTFKLNLNACGIHKGSLFPDINGLAEYQSWQYKWGAQLQYDD